MSKEMFIDAHEQLIEEYLEAHPDATEAEALEAITDEKIDARYRDNFADRVDAAKQRAKDSGNWPPRKTEQSS